MAQDLLQRQNLNLGHSDFHLILVFHLQQVVAPQLEEHPLLVVLLEVAEGQLFVRLWISFVHLQGVVLPLFQALKFNNSRQGVKFWEIWLYQSIFCSIFVKFRQAERIKTPIYECDSFSVRCQGHQVIYTWFLLWAYKALMFPELWFGSAPCW